MALLKFLKGNYSSLNTKAITEGQVLICGDTGEMFVDVAADKRVKIGDFVVVSTVEALEALDATSVPTSRLYYVEDGNILARSNGAGWVQINKQKTLAELGGVSATTYATDKAALVQADTNNATAISDLETYVGTFTHETAKTVVEYINAKTDGVATSGNLEALGTRVTAAEGKLETLTGADTVEGSVAKALKDAKAYTDEKDTAMDARMDAVEGSVTALTGEESVAGSVKAIAKSYADSKDTAISAAKSAADAAQAAADAAQADVNALEAKVGTVAEGKTVVKMIEEAQAAATYDDSALAGRVATIEGDYLKASDKAELQGNINTVSGKVTTLIGSVEGDDGKSARTIASEEVAKIVAGADASYDTLKEVSDWISSHKDDASAMNSAIIALEGIVDGIGGEGEKATVVAYVTDAIAALNIGDYAKAADLTALAARVTTVEGQIATLNGDESTAGSVKKALADAKAYTDGKDSAMDIRVKALETDTHTHANKAELDKIKAGDKAKWDAAQANAEATAASALSAAKTELEGKISTAQSAAEGKVTELANGAVKANTDAIAKINGTGDGSFAKADATLKTNLEAYADQAETDAVATAKAYTESCLTWGEF